MSLLVLLLAASVGAHSVLFVDSSLPADFTPLPIAGVWPLQASRAARPTNPRYTLPIDAWRVPRCDALLMVHHGAKNVLFNLVFVCLLWLCGRMARKCGLCACISLSL